MSIIINFHEVHDAVWFDNIICFLIKKYNSVNLNDLINLYNSGGDLHNICHITVDDGDKSFYNVIYPVLKKHKIPATIFVSSDVAINRVNFWFQEIVGYERQNLLKIVSEVMDFNLNNKNHIHLDDILKCFTITQILEIINRYQKKFHPAKKPFQNMSVSELKEVENSGLVTIGAHTLRHPILANEEMQVSKDEIISSIANLADILGHEVTYFAYPNGLPGLDFGQREMGILNEIGCLCAFSTESGNFNQSSELLSIPRYGLSCGESRNYIKTRLFCGSHWNKIMELKPGNESVNRKALIKLIMKAELRGEI